MNYKYFLLIAGSRYYPESGTGNWIKAYETMEEAEAQVQDIGNYKYPKYIINNNDYDWYCVVDLQTWIMDQGLL